MAKLEEVFKIFKENGTEVYVSVGEKRGFAGKIVSVGDDFVELSGVTGSRFYNFANIIYVEAALGHKKAKKRPDVF
ncbi:MAG: hypothetical protein PVH45_04215 [Candidatus Omnitrophota bacterium]|jgi:hypothetical protein